MTITKTELIAQARSHLADSAGSSAFWGDTDLEIALDCAIGELLPLLPRGYIPSYLGDATANIVASKSEYEFSGDFGSDISGDIHTIDRVYYNSVPCREVTKDQITLFQNNHLLAPADDSPVYGPVDGGIMIYPVPAEAVTSGLALFYIKQPDKFSDDADSISLRQSLLEGIGQIAAGVAKMGRESAKEGLELKKGGYDTISRIIGKRIKLQED